MRSEREEELRREFSPPTKRFWKACGVCAYAIYCGISNHLNAELPGYEGLVLLNGTGSFVVGVLAFWYSIYAWRDKKKADRTWRRMIEIEEAKDMQEAERQ